MRIRLHSSGVGIWAKSGGFSSKFGLTSTELLDAYEILKRENLIDNLAMIHFHIGSQMNEIGPDGTRYWASCARAPDPGRKGVLRVIIFKDALTRWSGKYMLGEFKGVPNF